MYSLFLSLKKSSNEKASVISTNAALSGSSGHLPLISEPVAGNAGGIKEDSNFEKGGVTDEVVLPSMERDGDEQNTCLALPEDTEKMGLDQAATKAQAIIRGYLVLALPIYIYWCLEIFCFFFPVLFCYSFDTELCLFFSGKLCLLPFDFFPHPLQYCGSLLLSQLLTLLCLFLVVNECTS